jgi:uncharacterized RDD family membrane protein YckC
MSSMPERDAPGPWDSSQGAAPGQGGMPGAGAPGQGYGQPGQGYGAPRQEHGLPDSSVPRYQEQPGGGGMGRFQPESPVDLRETRVTGRRVIQFIIDSFLSDIIPGLSFWLFDRGHGVVHFAGWFISALIWVVVMVWYWVVRPNGHGGQTFAMQWLGLRVISKDGGPATMVQLFIRWICLIFDAWILTALVGYIVILCSKYRQRIGDHAARTLVVHATPWYSASGRQYASEDMSPRTRV